MFDTLRFQSLLTTETLGRDFRYFEELGSTNDFLLRGARGLPNGAAAAAGRQTAGKGRLGRKWFTPAGLSLALSVLVAAPGPGEARLLPVACANAAWEAAARFCGPSAAIKWPNDIVCRAGGETRKLCGILCETSGARGRLPVVCGFGFNLAQGPEDFAREGLPFACSVKTAAGTAPPAEEAAALILNALEAEVRDAFENGGRGCVGRYRSRLAGMEKPVRFIKDGGEETGVAEGVDDSGALLVKTEKGTVALGAGEVRVSGIYGERF